MGFSTIMPTSFPKTVLYIYRYRPRVNNRWDLVYHAKTVLVYRAISEEEMGIMILKPIIKQQKYRL